MYVFGVFLVRNFPHSDWIWRDALYLSVFSPNVWKNSEYEHFSRRDCDIYCKTTLHIKLPCISNKSLSIDTNCDYTEYKTKFSIKVFSSKCDQIRSFRLIWSHLLKISLVENYFLYSVSSKKYLQSLSWVMLKRFFHDV